MCSGGRSRPRGLRTQHFGAARSRPQAQCLGVGRPWRAAGGSAERSFQGFCDHESRGSSLPLPLEPFPREPPVSRARRPPLSSVPTGGCCAPGSFQGTPGTGGPGGKTSVGCRASQPGNPAGARQPRVLTVAPSQTSAAQEEAPPRGGRTSRGRGFRAHRQASAAWRPAVPGDSRCCRTGGALKQLPALCRCLRTHPNPASRAPSSRPRTTQGERRSSPSSSPSSGHTWHGSGTGEPAGRGVPTQSTSCPCDSAVQVQRPRGPWESRCEA